MPTGIIKIGFALFFGFISLAIISNLDLGIIDSTQYAFAQISNASSQQKQQQQQQASSSYSPPSPGQSVPPSQSPPPFPPPGPPPMRSLSQLQLASSANTTCVLTPSLIESEGTPQQIEGPYFVAGMPNRSDIRSDTSDGSIQQGIPLQLVIHVYQVDGNGQGGTNNTSAKVCTSLGGARVDIWHANAQGIYSGVQNDGTSGKTFLRGYQVTNDNGTAVFNTIYPGWYEGRAIHIHIKVTSFDGNTEKLDWTSQFYLDNSANEQVHTQAPYSNHGPVPLTNEQDGIFAGPSTDGLVDSNPGKHLMLDLTKSGQGYIGTFSVVVNSTGSKQQQ